MRNKFAILIIIASFLAMPMFGQRGTGQGRPQGNRPQPRQMTEENVKERVNRLASNLEMNEDQKKKIMDYELELYKKNQVERQRMMGDRESMRAYMMKQREEREKLSNLQAETAGIVILDPEQEKEIQQVLETKQKEETDLGAKSADTGKAIA